jgi:hypothetical protein
MRAQIPQQDGSGRNPSGKRKAWQPSFAATLVSVCASGALKDKNLAGSLGHFLFIDSSNRCNRLPNPAAERRFQIDFLA